VSLSAVGEDANRLEKPQEPVPRGGPVHGAPARIVLRSTGATLAQCSATRTRLVLPCGVRGIASRDIPLHRHLVRREVMLQPLVEISQGRLLWVGEHDRHGHALAVHPVLTREGAGLAHGRESFGHAIDIGRIDLHPSAVHLVSHPPAQVEPAPIVQGPEVARKEPAARESVVGQVIAAQVPAHERRCAQPHVAHLARAAGCGEARGMPRLGVRHDRDQGFPRHSHESFLRLRAGKGGAQRGPAGLGQSVRVEHVVGTGPPPNVAPERP
jgi:hypothetical protein